MGQSRSGVVGEERKAFEHLGEALGVLLMPSLTLLGVLLMPSLTLSCVATQNRSVSQYGGL